MEVNQTKYAPNFPVPRNQTYKFETIGNPEIKFTEDTKEADGKVTHSGYTAQLDGKDYPVKGDPNRDTVALKRVKPNLTQGISKKNGKMTGTFEILLWGSGALMTVTSKEIRGGKTYDNVATYDRDFN